MRGIHAILPAFALFGCTADFRERDWKALSPTERQAALLEVTSKCGLPDDRVWISDGDNVAIRPHPNDSYERVDCLIKGVQKLSGVKMGFVGNEAYKVNDQ